jgi:hypothetical protein
VLQVETMQILQHGKALAKPKTVVDVLAEVEQRSGVEGRRAFVDCPFG